jgi:hypothetical protein
VGVRGTRRYAVLLHECDHTLDVLRLLDVGGRAAGSQVGVVDRRPARGDRGLEETSAAKARLPMYDQSEMKLK